MPGCSSEESAETFVYEPSELLNPYTVYRAPLSSTLSRKQSLSKSLLTYQPRPSGNRSLCPVAKFPYTSPAYADISQEDEYHYTDYNDTSSIPSTVTLSAPLVSHVTDAGCGSPGHPSRKEDVFDELYHENGIVDQANWFRLSARSSEASAAQRALDRSAELFKGLDSDTSAGPSHDRLLNSIYGPATPGCEIQRYLRSLLLHNTFTGSDSSKEGLMIDLLDQVCRKPRPQIWTQLANHITVATRGHTRATGSSVQGRSFLILRLGLAVVLGFAGRTDKAVSIMSETLKLADKNPDIQFLSFISMLLKQDKSNSERLRGLVASSLRAFGVVLDPAVRTSTLQVESRFIREQMVKAFTNDQDLSSWIRAKYALEKAKFGDTPSIRNRAQRLLQGAFSATVIAKDTSLGLELHSLSLELHLPLELSPLSIFWIQLLRKRENHHAWSVFELSAADRLFRKGLQQISSSVLRHGLELAACQHKDSIALALFDQINKRKTQRHPFNEERLILRCLGKSGQEAAITAFVTRYLPHLSAHCSRSLRTTESTLSRLDKMRLMEILRALVRASIVRGDASKAEDWWKISIQINDPRRSDYNSMIALYSRRNDWHACFQMLDSMKAAGIAPNVATYASLFHLTGIRRDSASTVRLLDEMQQNGVIEDVVVSASILNAAIETGQWDRALELYRSIGSQQTDRVISATMLKAFLLVGAPYNVVKTFFHQSYPEPSLAPIRAWSILMQAACDAGEIAEAETILEEVVRYSRDPAQLSAHIFTILVAAYLRKGDLAAARKVFSRMDQSHIPLSSVSYALLIRSLLADNKVGRGSIYRFVDTLLLDQPWERAHASGRGQDLENVVTPVLLDASRNGDIVKVESYIQQLVQRKCSPSLVSSTIMLDAYRRAGHIDKLCMVWRHIYRLACNLRSTQDRTTTSNLLCIPLSIYIDGLTSACLHSEIHRVWKTMAEDGFGFDAQNWNHLAVALVRAGHVEQGFDIVERVLLPKSDEVRARSTRVLRSQTSKPQKSHVQGHDAEIHQASVQGVFQEEPALRPPNRRHQYRTPSLPNEVLDFNPSYALTDLVKDWRPNDSTWRPTFLTVAVFEKAYAQLQSGVPVLALLSGTDEEGDEHVACETSRGNESSKRDERGQNSPISLVAKLNHKYARTVSLIMLHRRRRKQRTSQKLPQPSKRGSNAA
jgi:pentatricopeptide repeat protein